MARDAWTDDRLDWRHQRERERRTIRRLSIGLWLTNAVGYVVVIALIFAIR